ncbi:MAG: HD domain-containing phosphohydrolase [Methylobacter sp.]|nr:HD domain-containing phosphohydrolase [Methylobacter sp.]MDP2098930.1 HD domain-containing phosphohydrolase [Methylobacter sp.]MDP2427904.1 HD domain-containing phosphohydrolase [Methylobacter sp.]MDP3054984.1 HD domain-containing phosphohydrolase [Methylobacter sp.]MDP3362881.1 HD domain-containing phosphohydrolase [Methylobacter sp.]
MNNIMGLEEKVKQTIKIFRRATESLDPADEQLKKLDIDFVRKLSRIIDMHPAIKSGQSKYIAEKSLLIAAVLDMSTEEKGSILYAGLLMQLGKIDLPGGLLTKPFYSMSVVEKHRYLGHSVESETLLNGLTQFKDAIILIRHQYEHYNGEGFPDGLAHHKIPLGSLILSVVSDYIGYLQGSMTGKEMFADAALSQLMIRKESHYDPEVVDIFAKLLRGATVEEVKDATAQSKLCVAATKRWRKGLLLNKPTNKLLSTSTLVEIALPQLKIGMTVDSIYFGSEPYVRNCIVDQSIIDYVTALTKNRGGNPTIKIYLN